MKRPNRYPYTRSQWVEITISGNISIKGFQKMKNILFDSRK